MKVERFGPTGALITVAEKYHGVIRLRMVALLPVVTNLAMQVCLLGKGRDELNLKESRPDIGSLTCPARRRELLYVLGLAELIALISLPDTSAAVREVRIPEPAAGITRYLRVFIGTSGMIPVPDWKRRPEAFLLEAKMCRFFNPKKRRTVSIFWLMTHTDVNERLNRLRHMHPILRRNDEAAADALHDIYKRLTGGKDNDLMTCDLGE